MNQNLKLVLLITLTICLNCLRTANDSPPQYFQPQKYQLELSHIQNQLIDQMAQLNKQIDGINELIADTDMATRTKIVRLSEAMADERNQLYDIQQFLQLPYKLKICQCKTLTDEEMSEIEEKMSEIQNQIKTLEQKIGSCEANGECTKTQQLKTQISNMKLYLESLHKIVNSECCRQRLQFQPQQAVGMVNLNQSLVKDNLKAENWFYGTTNENQYRYKTFQLSTKFNVSSCPLNTPYADHKTDSCFQCPGNNTMFNLGNRQCYTCRQGTYLNINNSLCEPCPQFTHFNYTLRKCVQCAGQKFFNQTSYKCELCKTSNGEYYDSTTRTCRTCPPKQEYDILTKRCQECSGNQYFNSKTYKCEACPLGQFFDAASKQCNRCQGRRYFSDKQKKCVRCPQNTELNLTTLVCEPCKPGENYNGTIGICSFCQDGRYYNETTKKCQASHVSKQCPADHPYYNSFQHKCEQCPSGFVYDWDLYKCKRGNNIGICPPQTPVYNYQAKKCQQCPPGQVYNKYFYQCEPDGEATVSNT